MRVSHPLMIAKARPELPVLPFKRQSAFATWLRKHHATASGLWIRFAKKASGIPSITYQEALDVALCYGWIDGQNRSLGDDYFVQRFTPRTRRSKWSKINCAKAESLIASGRMQPRGLAEITAARSDGRWDAAYAGPTTIGVPDDLLAALGRNKRAKAFFATLDSRNRYAILYRVQEAKKPETRARRIEKFVAMLSKRETIH